MALPEYWCALSAEVRAANNRVVFESAKTTVAFLQHFGGIEDVLAAFPSETDRSRNYEVADALLRALIVAYQRTREPLFATLVLLGCWPMLCKLCGSIGSRQLIGTDEIAHIGLESLYDSVRAFILNGSEGKAFARLRDRIAYRFYSRINKERKCRELVSEFLDEHELVYEPANDLPGELVELVGQDRISLIEATWLEGMQLEDYVALTFPGQDSAEQRRTCHRLRKQRARAKKRISNFLGSEFSNDGT